MFKNPVKADLRLIATEINEKIDDKMTIADLNNLISNSALYKADPAQVISIGNSIIEQRKNEEQRQLELERIRLERVKSELELQKLRTETKSDISEKEIELCSLDALIKSIRTLTLKAPSKPEGWSLFFSSLERAFVAKNVPSKHKAEILLNLLGEKASNIITYLKEEEIGNYDKVKSLILREFEPTPQACLEQFRKTTRQPGETWVQFGSRLVTSWKYYLELRKVSDFEKLKELIVADKIFQTLDKETAAHISIRQANQWFDPLKLSQEIDLYSTSRGKPAESYNASRKYQNSKNVSKVFFSDIKNSKCVVCSEFHPLYKCADYKKLSVSERMDIIKNNNLCFNCLSHHKVAVCKSKYKCFHCGKSHHMSLCYSQEKSANFLSEKKSNAKQAPFISSFETEDSNKSVSQNLTALSPHSSEFVPRENSSPPEKLFTTRSNNNSKTVLLSTAICYIADEMSNIHKIRCILDSGAMASLITNSCVERIGLKRQKINRFLTGINEVTMNVRSKVNATLTNDDLSFQTNLDLLIVPRITDSLLPSERLNVDKQELNRIKLADENFYLPGNIDVLLGAEIFYEILIPGQLHPLNTNLTLQNSVFGYIVSGNVPISKVDNIYCGLITDNSELEKSIKKFWEIENLESEPLKNKEMAICEEHFLESHSRDETGKYIVKMPLRKNPVCLGKSRDIAVRRLNSLWNRFKVDKGYLKLYKQFLTEYENLGHMSEVIDNEEEGMYYIPHLGVYRPESNTTPLRVVFDASSRSSNGVSLNALQYNGGVPQDDLLAIMIRFRIHIFAFTADVTKMYRMIWIHPEQRKLQRIVWKEGINEPVKTYELATVTYGTTSAPFLATRTLKQLAQDEANQFPLAAQVVMRDMYIDDILSGAETLNEAKELQKQLIGIFEKAGMSLHKWCSNDNSLVQDKEENYTFANAIESKTLGVLWNQKIDCFTFKVETDVKPSPRKRDVLSTIAKLFDPLGLLGPVITKAKIFMQQLWLLKIDWDERLPVKEACEWQEFVQSLMVLNDINIERCIVIESAEVTELHGFCDASEQAYGATIYARSVTSDGEVKVKLIASKSRVAPIKQVTIPRLELCGAVLLTKLMHKVQNALKMNITSIFYWTDSTIVLSWMKKESRDLKTFVANRVVIIQEFTEMDQWHHVPSEQNPADCLSRGVSANSLLTSELWWHGPQFLRDTESILAVENFPLTSDETLLSLDDGSNELKKTKNCTVTTDCSSDSKVFIVSELNNSEILKNLLNCSNNYFKIVRILSFVFRFVNNCRFPVDRKIGNLKGKELIFAEEFLLKEVQKETFSEEIKSLKRNEDLPSKSKIIPLSPFIDERGLLRVGGRLKNSDLAFQTKYPVLLPAKHKVTELIIETFHKKYLHLGAQSLLYQIRQSYWPINGRNVCRKVVRKCVKCFKERPTVNYQKMGDLPKERVNPGFVFHNVGLDLCGPFFIKNRNQRKGPGLKVYICIFVCLATKALHLEIISDLTSESLISTLKRFFARRGKCKMLFSDNASNFTGANREIRRFHQLMKSPDQSLGNYLAEEKLEWSFIPPRAPNFGGLWEAGVKAFKFHFKRVIGNAKLTYEELLTVTNQIEAMLNSRPLTPLSSDIDDLDVLTPGHFLIGRPLTTLIEPNLLNVNNNRLNLWQRVTKYVQMIWKRWSVNYLNNLQQRSKWQFDKENVKINDMVIVREDNLPVCKWILGRIVKIYPGKDNKIRVVDVKTQTGVYKRSVTKLAVLPIET